MPFLKDFADRVADLPPAAPPAVIMKRDELVQLAQSAARVTAESGVPALSEPQRDRVAAVTTANPADLLTRLSSAVKQDPPAAAALGISGDEIGKVAAQCVALHGFVTQAQQTDDAARGQATLITDRTEALFDKLAGYGALVGDEPAGARPPGERDAILGALTAPLSVWQAQRARQSEQRRAAERVAAPLKERLALSDSAASDLEEINRLLDAGRRA